jgi:putative membrane-bound dehydrogenase-like protein
MPSGFPCSLRRLLIGALVLIVAACALAADPTPGTQPAGPLTPREELATFKAPKGFRVELVASEPDVIDPVAMAFDEDGRLYVAEMRGYPNGGVGTGTITSGRIKVLEDRDGDGVFETSRVFAENLRFPTSVFPYKGGLFVANAPDLIYFDANGKLTRLYTGFNLANIQQLLNSFNWGLDNRIYAVAGSDGGTIKSVEKPESPAVVLRNRGIRFDPTRPASLEPTSGGGQYGLACDDGERWFTATNSQHLRHIVLPDHYLKRNPLLPVSAVTLDIPEHGAACKVHRISPFEAWRVERTTRRANGPDAQRFPSTELVPGGFITSACSPVVYTADLFPPEYRGNTLVCDPANNLIHRDVLEQKGATFIAKRGDADCEFLASTDTWFRPVWLTLGPDSAIYVLDFYREVIETPLSLPDDIKKKLNLESRGRGRIWRIAPEGLKPVPLPKLSKSSSAELVKLLERPNRWQRITAQRLLVERQDRGVVKQLEAMATSSTALGRMHALWTLHGLSALPEDAIVAALEHENADLREQALRLAEGKLAGSEKLRRAVAKLGDDPSPRVRFQLAFTLGEAKAPELAAPLAKIARRDAGDPWTQTAVLSSAAVLAPDLLAEFLRDEAFLRDATATQLQLLTRLGVLVGTQSTDEEFARTLQQLAREGKTAGWQSAVLEGLLQGLRNRSQPLGDLWDNPPPALRASVEKVRAMFEKAAQTAVAQKRPVEERFAALRLMGQGPFALVEKTVPALLAPQQPAEIQLAAIRAASLHDRPAVSEWLLAGWTGYSPGVRREVVEAMFARPSRLNALLTALEEKKMEAGQLEPARLDQLRKHRDPAVRRRIEAIAGQPTERSKVVEAYRSALDLQPDAARGKGIFKKTCTTCHRLENEGFEVGPDLVAALRNKSPEQLLTDILDPSKEVDPRYVNYVVTTKKGQTYSGLIAADTAASITLRRGERAEDVILRSQIDEITSTTKSVMPEGLETQLSKQDLADVIAYLMKAGAPKK